MEDRRVALPPGSRIHGIEVTDCFAQGGLSLVYRALHPLHGEVILKEFQPERSSRAPDGVMTDLPSGCEELLQDFHREAHNLNAIGKRLDGDERWRVPTLYGEYIANGTQYLALEMIGGEGIHQRALRMRSRDRDGFGGWAHETFDILAEALACFEAAGILHGDITPDNVIIATDGRPTIIDFGSAFHRRDYRIALGPSHPSYRPPREVTDAVVGGGWVDVHGLCATFHFLVTGRPPFEGGARARSLLGPEHGDQPASAIASVLRAIDHGMVLSPAQPIIGADGLREILAGGREGPAVGSPLPTPIAARMKRTPRMTNERTARNQSCILQSFDTPRFRPDDSKWLKRTDGTPLVTSMEQKIALARAEALLAICFGREIVVPAGQVADSLGFEDVFNEIHAAYSPRREAIREACGRVRMPEWRPFRLGLERPELRDYLGFTQSYRYTGADLVLLKINDESVDKEKKTGEFLQMAVGMFGRGEFAQLGDLMLKHAARPNFEPFARNINEYFDPSASLFADPQVPEVSTGEYASLFRARLEDARLAGRGVDLAREALKIVTQIESDLTQHGLQGFRGNWYVYRKKFENTWPLARAYLDFRLFMNLARLYDVDHPIFVSQAFEYGVFDHSLFLGPKFSAESAENPEREVDLLKLAACTTSGVNWDEVLDMFLDDRFLHSIRMMNRHFFSSDPDDAADYPHLLQAHAELLARKAATFLRVDPQQATVSSKPDETAEDVMIDAVDAVSHPDAFSQRARSSLDSVTFGTGSTPRGGALVAIAPIDATGNFNIGGRLADQMLNYYVKPYRMLLNRDA